MLIKHDESPIWSEYIYNGRALSHKLSLLRHVQSRPPWLRATLITTLALLGGTLLVSVITVLVTSLHTYILTPADLLPADETLILFSSTDDALLRQYETWLPILKTLPVAEIPRTVAVVQVPNEGKALVVFARRPVAPDALPSGAKWTQHEVGPLFVSASSPAVFPLLQEPARPLRSSQAFTLLARGGTEQSPWIFVERSLLPAPTTLTDSVLDTLFLHSTSHLGIFPRSGSGMIVRLFPASTDGRSLSLPHPMGRTPEFSIALARPESTLGELQGKLSQESRIMLDTRMLTFFSETFGDDVSFLYDVLPLLARPARLSLSRTASGTLSLLLQGSASDAAPAIARLHEAFRGSRTTARTVTRVFDGRYTFRNVRDDTHMITDELVSVGGMQMHKTIHATQGEFCSAIQGEDFLLSTDCMLLEHAILERPQGPGASALAAGTFSSASLSLLLGSDLPTLLLPASPLLPTNDDTLQWSLSRQGDILTLTLLPVPSQVVSGIEESGAGGALP
ncbi:MAG: hypothetical protein PHO20_03785 [Candidatus Peribacteraceae bacterium]|nr:hypothetical protein [Candidatus Peribacteraceae bacterium]MDD5739862.1 hypothetical protein [Candidatus Peribacteraceae bacterium]